jgi:phosphate transport system substrate-binding protein
MAPLLRSWAQGLYGSDAAAHLEIDARGSSTGPPALVSGRAPLASMSREMKWAELEVFRTQYGYEPQRVRVAVDAVVVFVQVDSSLQSLPVPWLDAIYSKTLACGAPRTARRWQDVGVTGPWASRVIHPCGLPRTSGTRSFFRQRALCGGRYREDLRDQPGGQSAVRFVAEGFCGIGYGGLQVEASGVRILSLAPEASAEAVVPSAETIYAGTYPLSRFLNLYVNRAPGQPLPEPVAQFLRYVLSDAGQARVAELGLLPLAPDTRAAERVALESNILQPPARTRGR